MGEARKAQVIADFIAKYTGPQEDKDLSESSEWVLHVDGSSTRVGSGTDLVLERP